MTDSQTQLQEFGSRLKLSEAYGELKVSYLNNRSQQNCN